MRRIALAALLLPATLASGQWLGEKLSLLDTFGIPAGHQSLAYNNRDHTVYLSGSESESILVINADRCKSVARVGVGGGVRAMCYNPVANKLYCAYAEADTVVVLDGTTLQMLAWVGVGDSAGTFCCDSIDNKMYVGNWGSGSVSVIDCHADTVVATVDSCGGSREAPNGMCFVATHQSVYVTNRSDSSVVVIDCSSDTVLARTPVGENPLAFCYNPTNDRVYCACWYGTVYGIDAVSNQIVSVIPRGFAFSLACDPARNVLFVPDGGGLVIVDCSADTVIAGIELPEGGAGLVEYDPVGAKVYVAEDVDGCWTPGAIIVLDGEGYEVLTWFKAFYTVDAVCMTEALGRLFVAGVADAGVRVVAFDGSTDRLRGVWRGGCHAVGLLADSESNKLYCMSDAYFVSVVDPTTDTVLTNAPVAGHPVVACINAVDNKVYVATVDWDCRGKIAVLDGAGDTLLAEVATHRDPTLLAFDSSGDVLYVAAYHNHYIQAIDGKTDLVIDSLWVREPPVDLVYNDAAHRLYSLGGTNITVVTPGVQGQNNYIAVGAALRCFALNSTGTRLYAGSAKHDSVYVVDCVRETLAFAVPVAGPPTALCHVAPHKRLFSASERGGAVSVIDCVRHAVVATVPVSASLLFYDSASDAVYCLGDDKLTVVDVQSSQVLTTFYTGWSPAGITSAPGWSHLYFGVGDEPYLYVIRKPDGPAEMAVPAAPEAQQATIARGSLRWVGKAQAAVFDRSGRRVGDLHPGGNDVSRLAPGVYFVREAPAQAQTVRKLVVTR